LGLPNLDDGWFALNNLNRSAALSEPYLLDAIR
jgi:hypothetical protein